ncbi:hypothetical protein B0H13DRAFT_2426384 [Mycena leptocephala]|nr:hypothetical protein B0H13DRAFT_2426384 [Mycena leptocephala]
MSSSAVLIQSLPNCSDPSHHWAALSPHNNTTNSPILPPNSGLPSPAYPKPSFFHGPKSSMPKVEHVSIWLRWAVDPASALRVLLLPPLIALPTHLLPSFGNPFTLFFLFSHPTPAPERLSSAVVRPELVPVTQLYLKGPGDLVLLAYSVVLFSFLWLVLSHTLFLMLAQRWGIRKAGKVYTLPTTPAFSALKPRTPHLWLDRRSATFFSNAHARPCVDWRLASGWDAGRQSLTCQV